MADSVPRRQQPESIQTELARTTLSVVDRPLIDLTLDPKNPRVHSKQQIRQIAKSIQTFGFNVPVLIDRRGQVIAGHGRVLAAQSLGMTHVPTLMLEHLNEAQTRAFMIADNRLTENSVWDDQLLAEQLKSLSALELDFNIEVTGFQMAEIDLRIEGCVPAGRHKEDPADVIFDFGSKPQVSRAGDVWMLDRHRVYCGDARDDSAFTALMKGRRANLVFADPPYNDPIDGYVTGFGKIHHPEFSVASGEMSASEFTDFLTTVFARLGRNSVEGSLHFVCMDWRHASELISAARSVYTEFKNLCIWVKDSAGQGSLYRSQHELIFVFKAGKGPHRNNIQLGQHGRYRSNIWEYARVNSPRKTEEGNLSTLHPTVKPVQLVADAILDCTARGDIVLDPFLGSGTTVIAAERTGRVCYAIELEPRYVDTIVRRWHAFTGQMARQESSGRTFREIEEENNGRTE